MILSLWMFHTMSDNPVDSFIHLFYSCSFIFFTNKSHGLLTLANLNNLKYLDIRKLQFISLTIFLPPSMKRGLFMFTGKYSTTFTRKVIYSPSVWTILSGSFKSTHWSLMQLTGGTEQARCCHSVALQHSAVTFIDFLFDGIIWSLYRSQMKWSSVPLAQLNVQGPFSNTVNCISKRINDTFAVTISFFWCHLISSVKWLHQ